MFVPAESKGIEPSSCWMARFSRPVEYHYSLLSIRRRGKGLNLRIRLDGYGLANRHIAALSPLRDMFFDKPETGKTGSFMRSQWGSNPRSPILQIGAVADIGFVIRCEICGRWLLPISRTTVYVTKAEDEGVEPPLLGSEPSVLPLDEPSMCTVFHLCTGKAGAP